jgi:hypothetical protein
MSILHGQFRDILAFTEHDVEAVDLLASAADDDLIVADALDEV